MRWLLACTLALVLLPWHISSARSFNKKYDVFIEQAVRDFWGDYPFPSSWKAQLYQESRLIPNSESPAGALGLAQFMPYTWKDIAPKANVRLSAILDPESSIRAGAYYMRWLRKNWKAERPLEDRQMLAQASYNSGLCHILQSQKLCGMPVLYEDIVTCLPSVLHCTTGKPINYKEPLEYVEKIKIWRAAIELGN